MIFLWTWGLLREDCMSMGWEKEMKSIQSMKFRRYKLNVKLKPLHHFLDIILINFKSYNWNLCLFTAEPRMWIYINWFQMSIAEIIGDLCTNKTLHDKSLKTWQFIRVCVECVWRIWQSCNMEQAKNKLQYCCSSRHGHADFVRAWSRGICLWISFLFRFLYTWYSLVRSRSDSNST